MRSAAQKALPSSFGSTRIFRLRFSVTLVLYSLDISGNLFLITFIVNRGWNEKTKALAVHLMKCIRAWQKNLRELPPLSISIEHPKLPLPLNATKCVNVALLTMADMDVNDLPVIKITEERVWQFRAMSLLRLLCIGIMVGRQQMGPIVGSAALNYKDYKELFFRLNGSWLAEREDLAKSLVTLNVISSRTFDSMQFNKSTKAAAEVKQSKKRKANDEEDSQSEPKTKKQKLDEAVEEKEPPKEPIKVAEEEKEKARKEDDDESSELSLEARLNAKPIAKPEPELKPRERCPSCPKTFSSVGNLLEHIRTIHGEPKHSCPHCSKTFYKPFKLRLHIKNQHRLETINVRTMRFNCSECAAYFHSSETRDAHYSLMHKARISFNTKIVKMRK